MPLDLTGKVLRKLRLPTVDYTGAPRQVVQAQEDDINSRFLSIEMYDDRGIVDLSIYDECKFTTKYLGEDDGRYFDADIDKEENKVYCKLTQQMLKKEGTLHCDIRLKGLDSQGEVVELTSQTFYVSVDNTIYEETIPEDDDRLVTLDGLIERVEDLETAVEDAESIRESNEEVRQQSYEEAKSIAEESKGIAVDVERRANNGEFDGAAATISVGTVELGDSDDFPTIVNSGTQNAAVFDFIIPAPKKGDKGETGAPGKMVPIKVVANMWNYNDESGEYQIVIAPSQHNLGAIPHLFVSALPNDGSEYVQTADSVIISDDGIVTLTAHVPWEGYVRLMGGAVEAIDADARARMSELELIITDVATHDDIAAKVNEHNVDPTAHASLLTETATAEQGKKADTALQPTNILAGTNITLNKSDGYVTINSSDPTKAPIANPNFTGTIQQGGRQIGELRTVFSSVAVTSGLFVAHITAVYLGNRVWKISGSGTPIGSGSANTYGLSRNKIASALGFSDGFFSAEEFQSNGKWFKWVKASGLIANDGTTSQANSPHGIAPVMMFPAGDNILFGRIYSTGAAEAAWSDNVIFGTAPNAFLISFEFKLNATQD